MYGTTEARAQPTVESVHVLLKESIPRHALTAGGFRVQGSRSEGENQFPPPCFFFYFTSKSLLRLALALCCSGDHCTSIITLTY